RGTAPFPGFWAPSAATRLPADLADPHLVVGPVESQPRTSLPTLAAVPKRSGEERKPDRCLDVHHRPRRRSRDLAPGLRLVQGAAGQPAPVRNVGGDLKGVEVALAFATEGVVRHHDPVVDPILGSASPDVDDARPRGLRKDLDELVVVSDGVEDEPVLAMAVRLVLKRESDADRTVDQGGREDGHSATCGGRKDRFRVGEARTEESEELP